MKEGESGLSGMIGHNRGDITVTVEVRLFNSLAKYADDLRPVRLEVPAGSNVGDILQRLKIPGDKVYLALRNGRDITPSLHDPVNEDTVLDEGDVLGLSGPVPYSWGYGAPIV